MRDDIAHFIAANLAFITAISVFFYGFSQLFSIRSVPMLFVLAVLNLLFGLGERAESTRAGNARRAPFHTMFHEAH